MMDFRSRQAVKEGKYEIERFWGQTVIYLPLELGDKISEHSGLDLIS